MVIVLILCLLLCHPTHQPIVFVSDRARTNKEIEHEGIRGEKKKKPKVRSQGVGGGGGGSKRGVS